MRENMCVCVCVCVCERERERERKRTRDRERECVCACERERERAQERERETECVRDREKERKKQRKTYLAIYYENGQKLTAIVFIRPIVAIFSPITHNPITSTIAITTVKIIAGRTVGCTGQRLLQQTSSQNYVAIEYIINYRTPHNF